MNKNLLKYSSRFMAVLMASAIFTSCAKDEFTEKNALDLELRRMRVQDSIAMADSKLAQSQKIQLLQYQRQIDSLTAIDAGGKVFYSVVPVNATFTTFGAGDGRAENAEGEDGATVTASQYGVTIVSAGAKNGVYTFPVLHSGEVSVTVVKAGFSTANYIANLTPTGPVANGKITYVGNIIPLFKVSTVTSEMATVRGKAWVETDLTNSAREFAPAGTTFTAQVDVTRMSTMNGVTKSVFRRRFIEENNNQDFGVQGGNPGTGGVVGSGGTSSNGNPSNFKNGYIQRFGYEMTGLPTGTVNATGDYSFLSPASASGLPIKLEFSEFITDRTYYANNAVVTKRFAYGPNVTEDMYGVGINPATVTFKAFETEAVVTPTYTPEALGTSVGSVSIRNKGLYLLAPNVTGATGKNATYKVDLGITGGAKDNVYTDDANAITGLAQSQNGRAVGLRNIFAVTPEGTNNNYVAADDQTDLTVTRTDIFNIGTGTQAGAGAATGGIAAYIRVDNGGFGFVPTMTQAASTNANRHTATAAGNLDETSSGFTNTLPKVVFNQSNGVPFTVTTQSPATSVVVDQTLGTISHINTPGGGSFPSLPVVNFNYGAAASLGLSLGATGNDPNKNILVANGTGGLQFNSAYPSKAGQVVQTGSPLYNVTNSALTFSTSNGDGLGYGSNFVFVPNASVVLGGTTFPTPSRTATFQVFVNNNPNSTNLGKITRIELTNPGDYSIAGQVAGRDFISASNVPGVTVAGYSAASISISINAVNSNTLAATPFSFGTGITNYIINTSSTNVGTGATIAGGVNVLNLGVGSLATQGTEFNSATSLNPNNAASFFTAAGGITTTGGVTLQTFATQTNSIVNVVRNNTWLVAFDAPTTNPRVYAWGIPVYDNTGGLLGVRPISGGAGYTASTNMYLIPNAWRGITEAGQLPTDNNIRKILDDNNGAARINLSKTLARLTFAITTAGTKYSAAPILTTVGGGLAFDVRYSPTVVVMDKGGIKSAGSGTGSVTTTAIEFATDPKFTDVASLRVVVIDQISEGYNRVMRDALTQQANRTLAVQADGTRTIVKSNSDGRITAIDVKGNYVPSGTANPVTELFRYFPPLTFDYAPQVTISAPIGTGGVTATATSSILYDRTDAARWIANMVTVTNPTTNSGYRTGNYEDVTRRFTVYGGNNGSSPAGGVNNNNLNNSGTTSVTGGGSQENVESEDNVRFDVFPGITYARDVHYGTGKEIK